MCARLRSSSIHRYENSFFSFVFHLEKYLNYVSALASATCKKNNGPKVSEHHSSAQDHGSGVGGVGAHDVAGDVTTAGLEESVFLRHDDHDGRQSRQDIKTYASNVAARDDTRTANESGADVRDDGTIQVGHDHHVELLRTSHKLHGPDTTR